MPSFDDAAGELYQIAYRVAYRMLGSPLDAQDVAQEIAARAWVRWSKVEPYARAWVARSAANLVLDRLRRSGHRVGLEPAVVSPVNADRVELVMALRSLPKRQREVVVMRYLADLPEAEVAERLGCSVGAVKQHAHRGLVALRDGGHVTVEGER
ncbi:MAG TPA: sigma-70 family RNA polymerase sigma factor [Pseudonocardiaceae bacterium]|nr:sigma-70 family RNA polymerase sigma factor [Pseudonocardiaceae bacterium]